MNQTELEELIVLTNKSLGGINVPINEISSSVARISKLDQQTIEEFIREMVRNHKGIHFGMSVDIKGMPYIETISNDSDKAIPMPPNQNPFMK